MKDNNRGKKDDDSSELTQHKNNTSPRHIKPLTPTRTHPLMDLEHRKPPKGEYMDDSDETEEFVAVMHSRDETDDDVGSNDTIINQINQPPPESENYQVTTTNPEDAANNNDNIDRQALSDDEFDKGKLQHETDSQINQTPIENSVNANLKNNNPTDQDRSQSRIDDSLTKSTDKLDGNFAVYQRRNIVNLDFICRRDD